MTTGTRKAGEFCWINMLTPQPARARAFYSGLFGWTPEVTPMPGSNYTTFKHGTTPVAGMMAITPQMGKRRSHWGSYFTVKDAGAAAREAVDLGARLCVALRDIPGIGHFCGITSPQGVTFYVIQYQRTH